jgi:WD40 repeat protein
VSFGPSGIVAAAHDRTVHFLDANTGALVGEIEDAHDSAITGLQFAPVLLPIAGAKVAVLATGGRDKRVRLWKTP